MFELRCTVRNCLHPLHQRDGGLFCDAGHHFDRAKEGYWSLLQPQDRKSKNPGDTDAAVLARHRWLGRGHAAGLIDAIRPWINESRGSAADAPRTIDLGCGEGSFGPALFADEAAGYCGIDLSKRAIKMAARSWRPGTWVLANADRELPAADASVDRVLSLFGRRPVQEIHRVLKPGAVCIVAVPGEADLIELREQVQQAGHRRSRWEMVVDEMKTVGMEFSIHQAWQQTVQLDADAIADALAMTYRGVRHSQAGRLEGVTEMQVTLAADLIRFHRPVRTPPRPIQYRSRKL
ncbi:23S rRNA (guanine(745)-N(1))-methyltransferase [Rubripirellula lacrimiformis]|uniref:23S rRNA (Guanine(745)-N(1))-methyltransferase n=1 Tax=Rubripirellula lacrimiformis TaxID=1930273 RepID=A0A517NJE6_9BACT|nr:methyltransferase domain-containing protein [Rubripirellula lacrimiformis]QDT07264.1 23S rRNA (guanine(745)-N(1))-methyltransferase [Rubripirellula lacrimiformis]